MRIVITGATGYIGSNLLVKLIEENYDVYVLVRKKSDLSNIEEYLEAHKILNILDNRTLLYEKMRNIRPDIFIHLAGIFISNHSEENINELFDSNIRDSAVILDAVCNGGCKNIINTGSYWQMYDNEVYNPVNLYAATKEAFEKIIEYYIQNFECKAITLRLFDTYGKNDKRNKILNILNNLKDGQKIDMTKGEQFIYMCHIDDVVKAYIEAINQVQFLENGKHKVYAIRGELPIKLKDIVNRYVKISNKKLDINWGGREYRKKEIINPSGYGEVLPNWKPSIDLDTGLKDLIESR